MTDNKDITPLVAAFVAKMKSGGATPEQIQQAVDAYLEENPVQPGATVEQAAQIEKNKTDISELSEDMADAKKNLSDVNDIIIREVSTKLPYALDHPTRATAYEVAGFVEIKQVSKIKLYSKAVGNVIFGKHNRSDNTKTAIKTIPVVTGINDIDLDNTETISDEYVFYVANEEGSYCLTYVNDKSINRCVVAKDNVYDDGTYKGAWLIQLLSFIDVSEDIKKLQEDVSLRAMKSDVDNYISSLESDIKQKNTDKFREKIVAFLGDSYTFGAGDYSKDSTYVSMFETLHPTATVLNKSVSGSTIGKRGTASIQSQFDYFVSNYKYMKTNLEYEWTKRDNISFVSGTFVFNDVNEIDRMRILFTIPNEISESDRYIRIVSYDTVTKKTSKILKSYMLAKTNVLLESNIRTLSFNPSLKANEGEVIMLQCSGKIIGVVNDGKMVIKNESGNFINGTPMIQLYNNSLDYMVLSGGLNDNYFGALGSVTDSYEDELDLTTYCGGLEYMFRKCSESLQGTKIGYVIMMQYSTDEKWQTFVDAGIKACKKYGIPYLNLHEKFSGRFRNENKDVWSVNEDGTFNMHPSALGYEVINGSILSFMDSL